MLSHNNDISNISILDTTISPNIVISNNDISNIPSNFICNNCNKRFNSKSHLTQHKNKKKPCLSTKLIINKKEENNLLSIFNDKQIEGFIEKYQTLSKQYISINNLICEYQTKNKELASENLRYKLIIKSILQLINQKNVNVEIVDLDLDKNIILPIKQCCHG